jgi:flavin-binding protein dodecin
MAILKVIELMAESKKSWEDAADVAVSTASKTLRNVRSLNVKNLQATVKNGKIQTYRVNAKVTFELD